MPRRVLAFLFAALALVGSPLLLTAQTAPAVDPLNDRVMTGHWRVETPEGDICFLILRPGGSASCFWASGGADEIEKGRWELVEDHAVVNWEGGYRDVFFRQGERILKYNVGPGDPLFPHGELLLFAQRIDRRAVGSLAKTAEERADRNPEETDAELLSRLDPNRRPGGRIPPRSEFIGYWVVDRETSSGIFGRDSDQFFLMLDRAGEARAAMRLSRLDDDEGQGFWSVGDDEAVIHWQSGHKDVLRHSADGFTLAAFDRGDTRPDYTVAARPTTAPEVLQLFQAGSTTELLMSDLAGYWETRDQYGGELFFRIDRWGRATRFTAWEREEATATVGEWAMVGPRLVMRWPDGSHHVMRYVNEQFIVGAYGPGQAPQGTPDVEFIARKRDDRALETVSR